MQKFSRASQPQLTGIGARPQIQDMTDLTPDDIRYDNLGYFSWSAARRRPQATALIDLSRAEPLEITYGRLEERLDRFAALTLRLGLKPGDRLAMSVGNRFEFIEIMYGAMRAGVVPVPLSTRLGADVLEYIVKDAGCVAAVVEPAANPAFAEVVDKLGLRGASRSWIRAGRLARL